LQPKDGGTGTTPLSPLHARYDGFTLGAFVAVARYPFAADRYAFMRRRVHEYAQEAGLALRWPPAHADFRARPDQLLQETVTEARRISNELGDFVTIGAMAVLRAVAAPSLTRKQTQELHERWHPKLLSYGVQESGYDEWRDSFPRAKGRFVSAEQVLTSASGLLAFALEPLAADLDSCFVAMPFRPRFLRRYATLYAPALRKAGMRPLRAWGGVSSEEHYMTLMTVISRSGGTLAEITGLNRNVVHEIGITHGLAKPAYLVAERSTELVPSNLGHLPVIAYDPSTPGWESGAVQKMARFVRWMRKDYLERTRRYGVEVNVRATAVLRGGPRSPPPG
jgi:hypothetical protein